MNSSFEAAFSVSLSLLTRVVDPPAGALGYGTDLSCTTDLTPTLSEVDPSSPLAIVEAVIRRFTTPRGALIDDPDYGLDVRGHLNRAATTNDLRALAGALRGEAQKDDRVAEANVQLTASLSAMSIKVFITPADQNLQDFTFTFAVTDSSVLMVTING